MIKAFLLFAIIAVGIFMVGCTKDEQTYRKLNGAYTVTLIDIQHYNICKVKVSSTITLQRNDSAKIVYENAGEVIFSKKKSTIGNYRSGIIDITTPSYMVGADTIILRDSVSFLYYVDQLPQENKQKIGIVDDVNLRYKQIYRSTLISKNQKDINTLEFIYKMIPIRIKAGSTVDLNAAGCEFIKCKITLTKK